MKLAISNIAWETHDDSTVLTHLEEKSVKGIEVAPTKVWPNWEGASQKGAESYKRRLGNYGFQIPSMQAILFGKPELQLFDVSTHNLFMEHMRLVSDIAAGFGARVLVLGAPKNRKRGQLATKVAMEIAVEFLSKVGEICYANNCCIGLEHNPVEYGCDFITNAADARELVDRINHPGVQLHLDAAGLHMCGGNIGNAIKAVAPFVHYHISEPMLEPIANGIVDHECAFGVLKELDYSGWYSIEMKQPKSPELVSDSISQVLSLLSNS